MTEEFKDLKSVVCQRCGKNFTAQSRGHAKYCHDCRPIVQREQVRENGRERRRRESDISLSEAEACAGIGAGGSDLASSREEVLRTIGSRPAWCSPVRWRIECRRRANARWYAAWGDPVR